MVNRAIGIAAAQGILEDCHLAVLCEYGGTAEIGKKWADSISSRMNFVKHKATKAAH